MVLKALSAILLMFSSTVAIKAASIGLTYPVVISWNLLQALKTISEAPLHNIIFFLVAGSTTIIDILFLAEEKGIFWNTSLYFYLKLS